MTEKKLSADELVVNAQECPGVMVVSEEYQASCSWPQRGVVRAMARRENVVQRINTELEEGWEAKLNHDGRIYYIW